MADLTNDDLCYVQYTILIVVNYGCHQTHHIGPDIWVCWQIYVTNICRWLSIKDAPSGNIMCPTFFHMKLFTRIFAMEITIQVLTIILPTHA